MKTSKAIFSLFFFFLAGSVFCADSLSNYYVDDKGLPVAFYKDSNEELGYNLSTASDMITNGNYIGARDFLNSYLSYHPEDYLGIYYAGLNQLQLGNYAPAIKKLSVAKQKLGGQAQDNARYYYSVCLMAIDDVEGAKKELVVLASDETSEYKSIATDLIKTL